MILPCTICNRNFSTKQAFLAHVKTHRRELQIRLMRSNLAAIGASTSHDLDVIHDAEPLRMVFPNHPNGSRIIMNQNLHDQPAWPYNQGHAQGLAEEMRRMLSVNNARVNGSMVNQMGHQQTQHQPLYQGYPWQVHALMNPSLGPGGNPQHQNNLHQVTTALSLGRVSNPLYQNQLQQITTALSLGPVANHQHQSQIQQVSTALSLGRPIASPQNQNQPQQTATAFSSSRVGFVDLNHRHRYRPYTMTSGHVPASNVARSNVMSPRDIKAGPSNAALAGPVEGSGSSEYPNPNCYHGFGNVRDDIGPEADSIDLTLKL